MVIEGWTTGEKKCSHTNTTISDRAKYDGDKKNRLNLDHLLCLHKPM